MTSTWTRPAGWRLLLVHFVLVHGVAAVIRPTVSYRAIEIGVPLPLLGVLAAGYAAAPLLVAFSVGRTADRRGEGPVLAVGAGLMLVAAVGFAVLAPSAGWLLAWSVLLGTGHLMSVVAGQSLVAARLAPADVEHGFGVYTFAASLGQALGPAVVAVIGGAATAPDTTPIFLAAAAGSVALAVLTAVLVRGARGAHVARRARSGGELREAFTVPGLPRAVLVSLVVLSAVDLIGIYLPALGAQRGISAAVIGALLVARAVASMTTRFLLGRMVLRWGRRAVLVVSTWTAAIATGLLAVPLPTWGVGVLVVFAGLGLGVGQPLTLAWLVSVAPPRVRATALSLRLFGNRLGQTVLPAAVGLVASDAGVAGVFLGAGAILGVAAVVGRRAGG